MTNFDETKTIDAETLWNTPIPPCAGSSPICCPRACPSWPGPARRAKAGFVSGSACKSPAAGRSGGGRSLPAGPLPLPGGHLHRIQSRLLQIDGEGGSPNLLFQTRSGGIGQGLEAEITTALKHHPGIGLVVIDTLQKVRSVEPSAAPIPPTTGT